MTERRPTDMVQRVGRDALRLLQTREFVSFTHVKVGSRTSRETVKRAFDWLRDQGAPLEYVARERAWRLAADFALPLADPTAEDLQAALTAAGLLAELGQETAARRARALFDELAQRITGKAGRLRLASLRVSQTTAVARDPRWMLMLLRATRRQVVRIVNTSPWNGGRTEHDFEPWQVWLHDGVLYVRGFSRTRRAARTFRLANVESVAVLDGQVPRAVVPDDPWAGDDPRYGLDADRPGDAVVRLRGSVARWIASTRWHERQRDEWVIPGEVLERHLPYRSCRELARRLVGLGDGIDSIEPRELHDEVLRIANEVAATLGKRARRGRATRDK